MTALVVPTEGLCEASGSTGGCLIEQESASPTRILTATVAVTTCLLGALFARRAVVRVPCFAGCDTARIYCNTGSLFYREWSVYHDLCTTQATPGVCRNTSPPLRSTLLFDIDLLDHSPSVFPFSFHDTYIITHSQPPSVSLSS